MSNSEHVSIIEPYGGTLIDLVVSNEEREVLINRASRLPAVQLTARNLCDLELLATGGFSPLNRFLGKNDYCSVLEEMRLHQGAIFPIPITLSVAKQKNLKLDSEVALVDERNNLLAVMRVEEVYEWNPEQEARLVYGTTDLRHPLVAEMHSWGKINISGQLQVFDLPRHYDFQHLRLTPKQVRECLLP